MSNNANTALLENLFDKWFWSVKEDGLTDEAAETLAAEKAEVEIEQIPTPWG